MKKSSVLRHLTAQSSPQDVTQELDLHNCSFFANALEGIFRSTPAGRFTAVNPALVRMLGYESAEEVLALTLPDDLYVNPAQRAHLRATYEVGGELKAIEARWKKKGGEHLVVNLYARTIRDTRGTLIGYEGTVLDITERKQVEMEREASEAKYRLIFTASPDFLYLTDSAGKLLDANPAVLDWQGLSLEALQQRHFLDFFAGDNPEEVVQAFAALQQGHPVHGLEVRARNRRGETREFEVNATPLPDLQGGTVILSVARDITERRRAEAGVLEERNRIAREVHDSLAQGFAGIVLQLEAAKRTLTENSPKAQICLEEACALARAGLAEVRRSIMALRPQVLEGTDLPTALTRLTAQAALEIPPQVTFRVHGTPHPLPVEIESSLLRIAQEALANACHHAQARDIAIDLTFGARRMQLRVWDNGRGFDIGGRAGGSGFGLISMRERTEQIGGHFSAISRPGKGTTVAVIVPNLVPSKD